MLREFVYTEILERRNKCRVDDQGTMEVFVCLLKIALPRAREPGKVKGLQIARFPFQFSL